jgi:hypothetical protein
MLAKMTKDGILCSAMKEMKYMIDKPCSKVQEANNWGAKFAGDKKVKAAIE